MEASLRGTPDFSKKQHVFEASVQHGIACYSWFIYRFTQPAFRTMFMAPRNFFRMKEAILSVLAGDVFGKSPTTVPIFLFKCLYYLFILLHPTKNGWQYRLRRQNARKSQIWTET